MASSLSYFRRRLNETQRWSAAPPAYRVHAATSSVDDDVLERTGESFGAPYGESGFGTSEVFQELLSRDPKYVPISDLKSYQQGLIDTGYLPPTYAPTGQWDDVSAAADRRASRDAFNTSRSGGSWLAAPVSTLFRYMGHTVPTSVFDGMYGIAQGIVRDAATAVTSPVEVFEQGGLAGGAAVGAGIGAGVGSILPGAGTAAGAVVGGIIGGVAGLFGDLFDDDEEEEGAWDRIVGALTPIDEIRSGDAKVFFAAMSTIMTASAVLKAGQVARAGVQAAGGAGQLAARDAWRMAARGQVTPGILNQLTQGAIRHRTIGGAVVGGTLNAGHEFVTSGDVGQAIRDFGTGALIGAVGGRALGGTKAVTKVSQGAVNLLDKAPLARIAASPAGRVTTSIYTGMAAPTIVARAVSDLSGDKTAIGEAIEEAPDFGTAGTVLDWTVGSFIFPTRLLPWKGIDVANGMKAMTSNHALLPFVRFAQKEGTATRQFRDTFDKVKETMGRDKDGTFNPALLSARVQDSYLQHGIEIEATAKAQKRLAALPRPKSAFERATRDVEEARILMEERSALKQQILTEAEGATGNVVATPTGNRLLEVGMAEPTQMENFLATKGFDFEYWTQHQEATEYLNRRRTLLTEDANLKFTPAVKGEYLVAQDFERYGGVGKETGEYEARASRFVEARKALDRNTDDALTPQLERAVADAGEALDETVTVMRDMRIIDDDIYNLVRPLEGEPQVHTRLVKYLKDAAKMRPRRDDALTDELAAEGLDRYMAVATGENIIDYTHFVDAAEIEGLTEYARRSAFFDAIGSLGARIDRADLGRMRYQSIVRHLDKTVGDVVEGMDGQGAATRLYDDLKARYDPEAAKRKGIKLEVKYGSIIRRETKGGDITRELFKIDARDLTADDIVQAFDLERTVREGVDVYDAANRIKRSIHVGAAFGADTAHPIRTARALGSSLRINGLPGFNDFMRTINVVPQKLAGQGRFAKGSYGYLPQQLRRFHMALQFSLSPTFDASRYAEAYMFGKFRGGDIPLKAVINPKKFVREFEEGWRSPFDGRELRGQEAIDEMVAFGDRALYGRATNQNYDELQLRLLHRGVLGFKPREVEYAQAWWLAQKKARKGGLTQSDMEEIRETVMQIGQYGTKQTAGGNTMHFVFFPFLFSRKQLSAMVDFTLGAPTRNLLVHEGVRRWYEVTGEDGTSMSQDFAKFMEKHMPLGSELGRINNLAYGISPGRFFLEGILDKRTEGKVAQGLGSFFLPGGVHQPIADTLGAGAEQLKNLFVPIVITDENQAKGIMGLAERLVPAYRDLDRWFYDQDVHGAPFGIVGAQATALTGRGTPRAQMSEYLDMKRVMGTALEGLAVQSGYASWNSLASARPDVATAVNDLENDLASRFPEGARLSTEFQNKAQFKEQVLYDIASKDERTAAEDAVNTIGMIEVRAKEVAAQTGRTQEEMLRAIAPAIRQFAVGRTGDRQFMQLWDSLFRGYYGPLRRVEVA